jgi:flagellar hook-associated protein 3 FlgL
MIRVTTSTIFDRITTQLGQQQARLAETQERISTGRNYLKPSDAPDQVAALDRLESSVRKADQYLKNIAAVNDKLSLQELAITSVNDDLIRAKELLIQGANGTLDNTTKEALAIELDSIYNNLISVGNSKDTDGSYLFSGYIQGTPPFNAGNDPLLGDFNDFFAGNDAVQKIAIDEGYAVEAGLPGSRIFSGFKDSEGLDSNLFKVMKTAINALRSNDSVAIGAAVDNMNSGLEHVNVRLAQVGSKMRITETQTKILDERTLTLESMISSVKDLDYVSAVTELKNQSLALQAGQSSFAQISSLSLFNYIK